MNFEMAIAEVNLLKACAWSEEGKQTVCHVVIALVGKYSVFVRATVQAVGATRTQSRHEQRSFVTIPFHEQRNLLTRFFSRLQNKPLESTRYSWNENAFRGDVCIINENATQFDRITASWESGRVGVFRVGRVHATLPRQVGNRVSGKL